MEGTDNEDKVATLDPIATNLEVEAQLSGRRQT